MMKTTAQDVMTTQFHTLKPGISIAEAVMQFKKASQEEKQKVFGMMVTDEDGRLIGMLSLSDAARLRSGSCHACVSSRIKIDEHGHTNLC